MPTVLINRIVQSLGVACDSLVPNDHSTFFISHTTSEILTSNDVGKQKGQKSIAFLLLHSHNTLRVDWSHIQSLALGNRVNNHNRVDSTTNIPSLNSTVSVVRKLSVCNTNITVNGTQTVQSLSEFWRKSLVGQVATRKNGITSSSWWAFEHAKNRCSRGLWLCRLVGVELNRTTAFPGLSDSQIVLIVIDNHEFWWTLGWMRRPSMDVQRSKVTSYCKLLIKANVGKILVSKNQNSSLGCQQSKLVQPLR
ncbi:hypothetical protein OGAPHI_006836 [Ogataea philodendri]|uniref:Uncharacterized protein n=1 Tax=Ogataea philodendri TaxID=1378263 RepID=A0A9P8T0Q8_9ASCO|nr:uncharacterized protein OGAPHI_006836 [Ogataea philodendri]KAH3661429.1 hypothetical protein OGAPHI_006836 [Ogataea philodendri]